MDLIKKIEAGHAENRNTDLMHDKHCFQKDINKKVREISCGVFLRVGSVKLYRFSAIQNYLKK